MVAQELNHRQVVLLQNGECLFRKTLYHTTDVKGPGRTQLDIALASIQGAMNEAGIERINEPIVEDENR